MCLVKPPFCSAVLLHSYQYGLVVGWMGNWLDNEMVIKYAFSYAVTSNHIHLIVKEDGEHRIIPQAIGLIAERTAQEFNQRKERKGAFWKDRYHSTAIESGEHLLRCLVYKV